MIPQHIIDTIIQSLDHPEFIGETVALEKKSDGYEGLCPFHEEKTPSFRVYQDHYHCYGCKAHGNALDFLMEKQGLSFPEAVRALASRTGVTIPASKSAQSAVPDQFSSLRDVLRRACAKYQQILLSPEGAAGMAVLTERGIDDDTIIRFGIGYAPEAWGTLTNDRSYKWDHLLAAGLASRKREKKGCYDFFRNRVLFPVRNNSGDVIAFGGRRVGKDGPKYINTAETPLYTKGAVLFGMQQAKQAIRMTRSIIVCEGFFDVITPAQAGIEHIVSTCGTALTETQTELVLSVADKVFFCFDGDAAGAKATWSAAEMLVPLASDRHEIRLCRLPAEEDPDSYVRKYGAASFQDVLDQAPTLTAYLVGEITRGAKIPEARAKSLSMAAALYRRFSAPGIKVFFRQYACEALQLSAEEFERLSASTPVIAGDNSLRACPCCGSEAQLTATDEGHRAMCGQCKLSTAIASCADDARNLWNRRERPRMRTQ